MQKRHRKNNARKKDRQNIKKTRIHLKRLTDRHLERHNDKQIDILETDTKK